MQQTGQRRGFVPGLSLLFEVRQARLDRAMLFQLVDRRYRSSEWRMHSDERTAAFDGWRQHLGVGFRDLAFHDRGHDLVGRQFGACRSVLTENMDIVEGFGTMVAQLQRRLASALVAVKHAMDGLGHDGSMSVCSGQKLAVWGDLSSGGENAGAATQRGQRDKCDQ